jgi:hypothetical protein
VRSSLVSPRILPFFLLLSGTTCLQAAVARESSAAPAVSPALLWLALSLGWLGSALFTLLDSALFAPDSDEIDNLEKLRPRSGQILKALREDLDRTWFTLLSGSLLFNLVFAFAAVGLLTDLSGASGIFRAALLPLAAIVLVFLLGEAVPGLLAARGRSATPAAPHLRATGGARRHRPGARGPDFHCRDAGVRNRACAPQPFKFSEYVLDDSTDADPPC